MRTRSLKQSCLAVAQIIAITLCLSAPVSAEKELPPLPPPPPQTGISGTSFSDALARLASRAFELLPIIQKEIEGPLAPWLEKMSLAVAGLIMIVGFARLWRENAGAGADLFWWCARLGVIFALMGSGPKIIDGMFVAGREISVGADGSSPLFQLYVKQRANFDIAYRAFAAGMFTVKGDPVKSAPGGVLGVLFSAESSVQDPVRRLESVSRDMPFLFDSLSFSRGVVIFGDFLLTMLGSFMMIAMRLAAPVMIALAIDRNMAQKVTYPYLWGVIVLTLVWPIVVLIIKAIAYLGGNVAMALGDKQQFYQFDDRTMQIIHSGSAHPYYTALFAAVIMLISGLCLWASPYIAYQLSVGRVYEGVSTTISSQVGQLMGAGIEYYSSSLGASISRQAEVQQAQSQYFSETLRSAAGLERDNLQARASRIIGVTGAQGSLTSYLAGVESARHMQVEGIKADKAFGNAEVGARYAMEKDNAWAGYDLAVTNQQAQQSFEYRNIMTDKRAETWGLGGKAAATLFHFAGDQRSAANDGVGSLLGAFGGPGRAVGSLVSTYGRTEGNTFRFMGNTAELAFDYGAIQQRFAGRTSALNDYTQWTMRNQGRAAARYDHNFDVYRGNVVKATNVRAEALTSAAYEGESIAKAGANKAYGISVGGYNQAYNLNLRANAVNYAGAVNAAAQARDAGVEAARLRAVAAVVSSVGHNIARDMELGLTLRY